MKRTWKLLFTLIFFLILSHPGFYANSGKVTPLQQLYVMKELISELHTVGIILNKDKVDRESLLPRLQRASAQLGLKLVIAEIKELRDIATNFRNLTDNHQVKAVLILDNDDIIGSEIGKKYLIKQSTLNNIPLFAPAREWVNEGALLYIYKEGNKTALYVNKKTAEVLSVTIPEKYLENTQFFAMNETNGE